MPKVLPQETEPAGPEAAQHQGQSVGQPVPRGRLRASGSGVDGTASARVEAARRH